MGKFDKDRYQKELALRFCLARGLVPFLEVPVRSSADISDNVELLTDIDVLGIGQNVGGALTRTIFDCKSSSKLSPINRAFWAAGLRDYTAATDAFVILNNRAMRNHKLSALTIRVDLHNDASFETLGRTYNPLFPNIEAYQGSIERWQALEDTYSVNQWASNLYQLVRADIPLSRTPWSEFRKLLAALRGARGYFDPERPAHMAIFFDILSAAFVVWMTLARDMLSTYEPNMKRSDFESALRYYLWGGREAYSLRQQLSKREGDGSNSNLELPAWSRLVQFAGIILDAPQSAINCAYTCKEISLRFATSPDLSFDDVLKNFLIDNDRPAQFIPNLSEYLVLAGGLPRDTSRIAEGAVFSFL